MSINFSGSLKTGWVDKTESDFSFTATPSLSWRIGFGVNNYLIAEGSGYSFDLGKQLLVKLRSGEMKIQT